jgi:hypothetical protein
MGRVFAARLAAVALGVALASPASAFLVNWDIDPAQSSFKLTVPDQNVSIGTISATMRLRNQNNAAWTQNNAPVDGLLATDVGAGISSIQFLGGASSLTGVNTGSYRPNPAAYNTATTDATNTAGTFTNSSSASGVYAARVNASVTFLTINTGYIAFRNVQYDVASAITAVSGTTFAANALSVGILDSQIAFDSVNGGTTGIGDALSQSGAILAVNSGAGSGTIVDLGGGNYRLTVPVNLPVAISLSGVNLNATATGTLVGFAFIPEPTTLVMLGLGIAGIAGYGRRRRH